MEGSMKIFLVESLGKVLENYLRESLEKLLVESRK